MPFLSLLIGGGLPLLKKAAGAALDALWSMRSLTTQQWLVVGALAGGAWLLSGLEERMACSDAARAFRAELKRAHDVELARERQAAREIGRAAVERAEEDAGKLKRQSAVIAEFIAKETFNVEPINIVSPTGVASPDPLFLHPDFRRIVHEFDAAAGETAPARRAKTSNRNGSAAKPGRCTAIEVFALLNRSAAAQCNRKVEGWTEFYANVRKEFGAQE